MTAESQVLAASRWLATQQHWDAAPRILRTCLEALPEAVRSRMDASPEDMEELARAAIQVEPSQRAEPYHRLLTRLSLLPEPYMRDMAAEWLSGDCVYLHLLIPDLLTAGSGYSAAFAEQVLDWGIHYPDPSLNRAFVEAALARLGRERVLARLLATTDGVAAAYYWVPPRADASKDERTINAELRRRLRPIAGYLRPWWAWW